MPLFDPLFWEDVLIQLADGNPITSTWFVIRHGGWVVLLWALLVGSFRVWHWRRSLAWWGRQKFILLAIDVPKGNEQGPKAAENIFSHLAGAHGSDTLWQKYWIGQSQLNFSLEIVSIDGYVQFIIRTPEKWRDLVEAAVYAQYPDAEITEIDDYTQYVPKHWPDAEWKFWGLEYKLFKPDAYPIRSYTEFEDTIAGEFKDPMAALMETLSTLRKGEQVWMQWVITPITDKWIREGEQLVKKIIGAEVKHEKKWYVKVVEAPANVLSTIFSHVFGSAEDPKAKRNEKPDTNIPPTMMLHLSPGERDVVTAMQRKMSKIGFQTKFRIMYFARKEVYDKARVMSAVIGATKQYNTIDLNRFDVCKKVWTQVYYLFVNTRLKYRQNKLFVAYAARSNWRGDVKGGFVLNIEELASLWHFPVAAVKAAQVKRTEAKKAEPPFTLPIDREEEHVSAQAASSHPASSTSSEEAAPPDLPTA